MQELKKCFKCKWVKPVEDFYKHPQMSGGRVNKCKSCNKADVTANRREKAEYYIEYDRQRMNEPKRVDARKLYAKTPEGIASGNKAKVKWSERNPIKTKASRMVSNYVRDGKMSKPDRCECCGVEARICGHHDDYAKPLDVRWLCDLCHRSWHKVNGEGLNGHSIP